MGDTSAEDEKASQTLIILGLSILSCFLVPSWLWIASSLCPRRKLKDDAPKLERDLHRFTFRTVLFWTVVGTAAAWYMSNQLTGARRQSSPFAVLELPDAADSGAIRKAYRRLSLVYHPDKPTGDADKFRRIVKAYETLTDPAQREAWERGGGDDDGVGGRDGMTGLEEVTVKSATGKLILLAYVGVLFVLLPLGVLAFRNSGHDRSQPPVQSEDLDDGELDGPAPGAGEGRAAEARFLEREERREAREAAARATKEAAREKAAARSAAVQAARASQRAAEEEVQRKRREEERVRGAAERDAAEALAKAAAEGVGQGDDSGQGEPWEGDPPPPAGSGKPSANLPWSAEETSALAKALAKYPGGVRNRWAQVAVFVSGAGFGRTSDECIRRAQEAANQVAARKAALAEAAAAAAAAFGAGAGVVASGGAATGGGGADDDDNDNSGEGAEGGGAGDAWSSEQQAQLEEAMRRIPASFGDKRWAAIAKCVAGKSQKQCIRRFKTLRAILLAKQQQQPQQ